MRRRSAWIWVLVWTGLTASVAGEPPDSRVNPDGDIESVESVWNGTNYEIRHVLDPRQGGAPRTLRVRERGARRPGCRVMTPLVASFRLYP